MVKTLSRNKLITALLLSLLFIGASSKLAIADESECSQTDSLVRNEYRCDTNNCGSKIFHREYRVVSGCGLPSYYYYTGSTTYKTLGSWLRCDPGQTSWQSSMVRYDCQGDCLKAPTNPTYNGAGSSSNVNLPANLSWTNVEGFGNMAEKGPISYNITIDNTNASPGEQSSYDFGHDYSGSGEFPLFSSLPGLDLSLGGGDGQFISVEGKYRFIRPTPSNIRTISSCFGNRWQSWKIPPSWGFHNGIDISSSGKITCTGYGVRFGANVCVSTSPLNAIPLFASAPGTITSVGDGQGAGNMVTINHSDYSFDQLSDSSKKETVYMHLSQFSGSAEYGSIRVNDKVTPSGEIWGVRVVGYDEDGDPIYQNVRIRDNTVIGWMGSTGISTGAHLHFEIKINGQRVDPLSLVTIPDGSPWIGSVPCLKAGSTALRSTNILASLPGEEDPFDEEKEEYYQFVPPFSYKEGGNPFSANVKGNKFSAENCLLRPSDTYNWTAQACCDWNGNNCGPISTWSFSTSNKLEQLKQGTESGTKESEAEIIYKLEDANLRWCEMRIKETVNIGGEQKTIFVVPDRYEVEIDQKTPFLLIFSTYKTHPLVKALGGSIFRLASPPETSPPTHIKNEEFLLFTKSKYANYRWRVRACVGDEKSESCNAFTPYRYISVSEDVKIKPPELLSPSNDSSGNAPISWPVKFRWNASLGANSYLFEMYEGSSLLYKEIVESVPSTAGEITRVHELILPKGSLNFKLDTLYKWQVKPCWDTEAKGCEPELSVRYFKTTGKAPELIHPTNNLTDVSIPPILEWEKVSGAKSYLLEVNGEKQVITENKVRVNNLKQGASYTWSVKSCNDGEGTVCGESSAAWTFQTLELTTPENLKSDKSSYNRSDDNATHLSWDEVTGANYYQVLISCGGDSILDKVTDKNELEIYPSCVGVNNWSVKACIDQDCTNFGPAGHSSFVFLQSTSNRVGLVPCGLSYDNPNTEWNENNPCEIHHLFIMLKIILDFLFWNLMPIVLVIMIIVSGVTFYTSLGNPNVLAKIKNIWLAVGKGLIIMFFGWSAIIIIMMIMGYRIGIYGPWWQLSF